jgi:hypothetical protein
MVADTNASVFLARPIDPFLLVAVKPERHSRDRSVALLNPIELVRGVKAVPDGLLAGSYLVKSR